MLNSVHTFKNVVVLFVYWNSFITACTIRCRSETKSFVVAHIYLRVLCTNMHGTEAQRRGHILFTRTVHLENYCMVFDEIWYLESVFTAVRGI